MSHEVYLELFGLTPEEIFTPEELARVEEIARRPKFPYARGRIKIPYRRKGKNDTVDKLSHLKELRRLKYIREKQKR